MAATDFERLVLAFEANTSNVEKQLKKLNDLVNRSMNDNKRSTDEFGNALGNAAGKGGMAANKLNKSLAATRFATANVAAQFQDIGVQLAGGQSPFQIALQQGTQLNQVLGQAGARGAVSLLGSAFASLLNPISLATIAIIALGGYAVQYFMKVVDGGEKSAEELDKQASLIQEVANKWGAALPALKAYADEQQRQSDIAKQQAATQGEAFNQLADAQEKMKSVGTDIGVFFGAANAQNASVQVRKLVDDYNAFRAAASRLDDAIKKGEDTSDAFANVQNKIASLMDSASAPAVARVRDEIDQLTKSYIDAAKRASELVGQQLALNSGPIGGETVAGGKSGRNAPSPLSDSQFASRTGWSDYFNFPSDKKPKMSAEDQQQKKIDDVIKSLQFEEAQLHRTDLQQEIYNQLKSAGVDINSKAGQQIAALVTQIDQEKASTKQAAEAAKFFGDALYQAFDALIPQINTGNKALDQFLNTLIKAAEQAILLGKGPLAGILGFGGGGLFSSLFAGFFADGGHIGAGKVGIVGERGPELIRGPADITPFGSVKPPSMAAMASTNTNISMPVYINAPGADAAQLRRVEQSVRDLRHSVPKIVDARNRDHQYRGTRP